MPNEEPEATDTRYCDCDIHGPHRHAYVVCSHIVDALNVSLARARDLIAYRKPWTDNPVDGCGQLFCSKPGEEHTIENLSLICEDTLLEIGIIKQGEIHLS